MAERIGDTIEIVEKTYYHMFPEKKKVPTNKLNELKLRGKRDLSKKKARIYELKYLIGGE